MEEVMVHTAASRVPVNGIEVTRCVEVLYRLAGPDYKDHTRPDRTRLYHS